MMFNAMAMASIGSSLRASSSRLVTPVIRQTLRSSRTITPLVPLPTRSSALSVRYSSHASLQTLSPAPGSKKEKRRRGMGMGSKRGGHSSGRGDKGAKARGKGVPYLGFEGGQTPLYKRIPKRGHKNFMHKEYRALNIVAVQRWIAAGRYDPTETLTIQKVSQTGMLGGLHKYNGVKLCGYASEEYGPLPPLTVHLSRFSKNAAEAITSAGGTCVSVYHNELGLRQELYPRRFEGAKAVKSAGPTRKKDIEFYTNPENFGYLSDPETKEAFFRSRGWNPDIKRDRFTGAMRTDVSQPEGVSIPGHRQAELSAEQ